MRQIFLTIKNSGRQLEVKDFLAECLHSPQWIGKAEDWKIKTFYLHEEEKPDIHGNMKRRHPITALLESESKEQVDATPMTAKEICDALKPYRNLNLSVGYRKGLRGRIEALDYGEVTSFINDKHCYVLCFAKQNNRPHIRVDDLLDVLDITNAPVLEQTAGGASGYPLTEVVIENDKAVLIYNQDIVCE